MGDEKGEQHRNRWYITCLDSPYRQYVVGMMNEIFSRYGGGAISGYLRDSVLRLSFARCEPLRQEWGTYPRAGSKHGGSGDGRGVPRDSESEDRSGWKVLEGDASTDGLAKGRGVGSTPPWRADRSGFAESAALHRSCS